jgi:predicted Zn finger-like uncharacterized protein
MCGIDLTKAGTRGGRRKLPPYRKQHDSVHARYEGVSSGKTTAMHVQCESCGTQYEFDDALVSGRGTTVKCSNCGFQFKVRKAGPPAEDHWLVTTADGSTYVYGSLRELQRAILTRQIDASDLLERGGVAPRPIGQIAELAPFFDEKRRPTSAPPAAHAAQIAESAHGPDTQAEPATQRTVPPGRTVQDPDRTAATPARLLEAQLAAMEAEGIEHKPADPGGSTSGSSQLAYTFGGYSPGAVRPRVLTEPDFAPVPPPRQLHDLDDEEMPTRVAVDSAPSGTELPSNGAAPPAAGTYAPSVELAPGVGEPARATSMAAQLPAQVATLSGLQAPLLPADVVAAAAGQWRDREVDPGGAGRIDETPFVPEVTSPLPASVRRARERETEVWADSDIPRAPAQRRSVGGMVIALVVVLAVGGMGAYYMRERLGAKPVAALDGKTEAFLAAGEKALSDGDLDSAKENFDKASVLAEANPRLLLDIARLQTGRADVSWLKQQALSSETEVAAEKKKTGELAALALVAADAALAVSPEDPSVVRTKIDALRAKGEVDKARTLVPKVVSQGNQSESAYVLAALDMSGPDPVWSTVLQRLRLAASIEGAQGRARAALVVALARSGDAEAAKGELARLESASPGHPLLATLRAFTGRKVNDAPAAAPSLTDDGGTANVDVSTLKALNGGAPTDPRVLVSQAEIAKSHGKLDVAKRLYELALQKSPQDSEALTGLAQVAHAQHDYATAKDAYKRVLGSNGSYVPALVGLADVEWESGDRAAAQKGYRDIVDRFQESAYPGRVKTRAEGASPTPVPSTTSTGTAAPTATATAPGPTATSEPTAPAPGTAPTQAPQPKAPEEPAP